MGFKYYGIPNVDLSGKPYNLLLQVRKPNGQTSNLVREVDQDNNPNDEVRWRVEDGLTPVNIIERAYANGNESVSMRHLLSDLKEVKPDPRDAPQEILTKEEAADYKQHGPKSTDETDPLGDEDVIGDGPGENE